MVTIFRKFFQFAGEHRRAWYASIVLEFLRGIAGTFQLVPLFLVLSNLIAGTLTTQIAWAALVLVALSTALQAVLHYFIYRLEMRACYLMLDDKRISIGERMKYMPMGYFNDRSLGNLTAICTATMEDLESLAGAIVVRILTGILHAVVFSLAFMAIDWRIGFVFLAGVVAVLLVNSRMLVLSRKHSPLRLAAQMSLVDAVLEYIQGMSVIKAFNLSGRAGTSIENAIDEAEKQNFNLEKKSIPYTVAQQVILRLFAVAAIASSVALYLSGGMELFVCLLVVIGGFLVYAKIEEACALSFMLPMVDASIDRVEEADSTPYMDEQGWVTSAAGSDIELEHVGFAYGDRTIVNDVSLVIPARTSCAIVGPSGSGKTTLVNLMARFWDVREGRVMLGGADVRDWKFDQFMAHFAMVFQAVYLFNDTIENNIRFGRPNATHDEVIAAARAARCHDFIEMLPDGYRTMLGEGGATISGGEKQRISIARAFLKDAPIVLLDEATANVDPENEAELQAAIEELTRQKTVVIIAHRLKTVRNADQIVALNNGRIVQQGTHDELMAEEGLYKDFVRKREQAISWKVGAAL
jgi:ATP-binding cassette subfamily B protein